MVLPDSTPPRCFPRLRGPVSLTTSGRPLAVAAASLGLERLLYALLELSHGLVHPTTFWLLSPKSMSLEGLKTQTDSCYLFPLFLSQGGWWEFVGIRHIGAMPPESYLALHWFSLSGFPPCLSSPRYLYEHSQLWPLALDGLEGSLFFSRPIRPSPSSSPCVLPRHHHQGCQLWFRTYFLN